MDDGPACLLPILNTTLTPAINLLIGQPLSKLSTVDTSPLRPQKPPSRPPPPPPHRAAPRSPSPLHPIRSVAEHSQPTSPLTHEHVWNGRNPIAVIEGGVISCVRGLSHPPPGLRDQRQRSQNLDRPPGPRRRARAHRALTSFHWKAVRARLTPSAASTPPPERPPPPASPASGSRANPASTRTGCATTTRPRGGTSRPTRWGAASSLTPP